MPDGAALASRQFLCPLELLFPSPTDPRGGDVGDLTALDVGEPGPDGEPIPIFEPLWVRTRPDGGFEIVRGNRRTAKARLKGLTHAPVEIHDELDDEAVRMLQLREVLQRRALTPMQEARAYGALRDELQLPVPEIAARLHVKQRVVEERLTLLTLQLDVQLALAEGRIAYGVAIALTGVRPERQAEALCDITKPLPSGGPMPASFAIDMIRRCFQEQPKAKTTQRELFEDETRADEGTPEAPPEKRQRKPRAEQAAKPAAPAKSPPSLTAKIEDATEQRLLSAIVAAGGKRKTDAALLRFAVAVAITGTDADALDPVLRHHACKGVGDLQRAVAKADEPLLRGLLFELFALSAFASPAPLREQLADKEALLAVLCRGLKIDGAKLCAEVEADVKTAEQPPSTAKKAAGAAAGKPLPTMAAPKKAKLAINLGAFLGEIEAFLVGMAGATVAAIKAHLAERVGVALTPHAEKVAEDAIRRGVERRKLQRVGEVVRVFAKTLEGAP